MNSRTYFQRNRGPWDSSTRFVVKDWRSFWTSSVPFGRKVQFLFFWAGQRVFGTYHLWTRVEFEDGAMVVNHETRLRKFGLTLMVSQKKFELEDNGSDLTLSGNEYFWPLLHRAHPFGPLRGWVDDSTTRAFYQMPLFGGRCECEARLGHRQGEVYLRTSWLDARFTLTPESRNILERRLINSS